MDLKELKIRGNPLTEDKEYSSYILSIIPTITKMDDQQISQEDRQKSETELQKRISAEMLKIRGEKFLKDLTSGGSKIQTQNPQDWRLRILELDLSHQHIMIIENLEGLNNLKLLNLAYNRIDEL